MCILKSRLLFALLTFGIGVFAASFLVNTLNVNKSSTENLQELNFITNPESANTNQSISETNDKVENWQIPIPAKRTRERVWTLNLPSVNGDLVKVTMTSYATGGFLTREPFDSKRLNQDFGLCEVDSFFEIKVKNKVIGYSIFAKQVKLDEKTGKPIGEKEPFFYQYMDNDGDGKFETAHLSSDFKFVVPSWAVQ